MTTYDFHKPNPHQPVSFEVSDNHRAREFSQAENAFHYSTLNEALAVYQQMQITNPQAPLALRAYLRSGHPVTLFERHGGENALVTDYRGVDVWRDNPRVEVSVRRALARLGVQWQVDRELVGAPVLVPYEPLDKVLDEYAYYKELAPEQREDPLSSIKAVGLKDGPEDGVPLGRFMDMVSASWRGERDYPMVEDFFLQWRDPLSGEVSLQTVEPMDFRNMKARYQKALEHERTTPSLDTEPKMDGPILPDQELSEYDMHRYGYEKDGMLPVGGERAEDLLGELPLYKLYDDSTSEPVKNLADVATHANQDGLFGVTEKDWREHVTERDKADLSLNDVKEEAVRRMNEKMADRSAVRDRRAPEI